MKRPAHTASRGRRSVVQRAWPALWVGLVMVAWVASGASRTVRFLFELGEPGIHLEVVGHKTVMSDAAGDVRIAIEASPGDVLKLRSRTAGFRLEHEIEVEDDPLGAIFRIDLRPLGHWAVLEPVAPKSRGTTEASESIEASESPESATVSETINVGPRTPCRDPEAPSCLSYWFDLVGERQCTAAAELDAVVRSANPGLGQPEPRLALAEAFLDCGLAEPHKETREDWLRRAAGLISEAGGEEPWCLEVPARLLAEVHEARGDVVAAEEAASAAVIRCPVGQRARAVEWGVYFALRAGHGENAAALARRSVGAQAVFLDAWIAAAEGRCATGWRALRELSSPCVALSRDLCSESVARMLVVCGTEREDFLSAARLIEDVVTPGAKEWGGAWVPQRQDLAGLLAEARFRGGRFADAAGLFSRLVELAEDRDLDDRDGVATIIWRRADALFLASEYDAAARSTETLDSLAHAYMEATKVLPKGSAGRAAALNNLAVLRGRRLDDAAAVEALRSATVGLEGAVATLPESVLKRELRWNLLVLEWHLLRETPIGPDAAASAGRLALARRLAARLANHSSERTKRP